MPRVKLETIFECIIEQMADGDDNWEMPWHGRHSLPLNADSGLSYKGINRIILWARSSREKFNSRHWATFNQWRKLKQPVAKGQKGTALVRPIIATNEAGEQELRGFHTFHVFNGDQVLNRNEKHPDLFGQEPIEIPDVERFVRGTGADIRIGGDRAVYFSREDLIRIPPPDSFIATRFSTRQQNYYSTLLHELVHWTGHSSRENRQGPFEDHRENYAFEELVAELGAAFLCSEFELEDVPRKSHAQYLNHWLQFIREQPELLWRASSLAQQAMTFLLETEAPEPESDASSPGWLQAQPTQVDLISPMSLNIARARSPR